MGKVEKWLLICFTPFPMIIIAWWLDDMFGFMGFVIGALGGGVISLAHAIFVAGPLLGTVRPWRKK